MAARIPEDDRFFDLLATRAVEGLSSGEHEELDRLAELHPDVDADMFDRAAASIAACRLRIEPMPAALRARILADAEAWLDKGERSPRGENVTRFRPAQSAPAAPKPATAWGGWLAAAAALLLAVTGWLQADKMGEERAALAARQAGLEESVARLERAVAEKDAALASFEEPAGNSLLSSLEARPGTLVIPWSTTDDPAAVGAEGDVLWNGAEQAGVMRFRGLQPNDPANAQYQLWIFDAERDDRYPVDGGVFDVLPGAEETLIPIRASVPVGQAVLFAVTVEAPGGVVVSSRERIALVAQPGA
jgi:hypothetical protein